LLIFALPIPRLPLPKKYANTSLIRANTFLTFFSIKDCNWKTAVLLYLSGPIVLSYRDTSRRGASRLTFHKTDI
jgi:hypothetical protein